MTKYIVHMWTNDGRTRTASVPAETAKLAVLQATMQYPAYQHFVAA